MRSPRSSRRASRVRHLTTPLTAVVFALAAWAVWGFEPLSALGVTLLLLVHELGHLIAARHLGVRAGPPVFVPLIGAFVALESFGESPTQRARIVLAGPNAGTVAVMALSPFLLVWPDGAWFELELIGLMLSAVNLVPAAPLDGWRALADTHPHAPVFGLVCLGFLAVWLPAPSTFALVAACSILSWYPLTHQRPRDGRSRDARLRRCALRSYVGAWIRLTVALALVMFARDAGSVG